MVAWYLCILTLALSAGAIPHPSAGPRSAAVYLKPYSAVPTGHHNLEYLKSTLIGREKIRWVLVKDVATGTSGWTPKQNLLTPLHFSTKARLLAKSPVYRKPTDTSPDPRLTPPSELAVDLVDVQSEWAMISFNVRTTTSLSNMTAWVPISHLYSVDKDPGYFYSRREQVLRKEPQVKSALLAKVPAGQRLRPMETKGNWVRVSYMGEKGLLTGFVPSYQIISRIDIAMKVKTDQGFEAPRPDMVSKKVFAIYVNPLWLGTAVHEVPLFSEPVASASVLGYIKPWQNLQQQDSIEQEWASSRSKELGVVWWQYPREGGLVPLTKLALTSIKQMKVNPVFKNIYVATAGGLYRTSDGVSWTPLRGFDSLNPAFTYAADGTLFVEDKVSFDNGEHFTPFVHWENLLHTLRSHGRGVREGVKILNVATNGTSSNQVVLELDIGAQRPVRMFSVNRGLSWALLR